MAVTRVTASSGGSTVNPLDRAIATGQVPKASANSSWNLQWLSSYNTPTISMATADRIDQAAQIQAEALRRAQEAQRLRLEAMARQAEQQNMQQQPLELFGAPMTGPLGRAISSFARDPFGAIGGFLTSEAPNFGVTTDAMGNPLTGESVTPKVDTKQKGPDKPGYMQQPVMDQYGNIAGYRYVQIAGRPTTPTAGEFDAYQSSNFDPRVTSKQTGYISLEDEIKFLEDSFQNRKVNAAIEIWGKPDEVENPDGSKKLVWGTNGMEYLGLTPGMVPTPTLNAPGPDATYDDLVKYRNRLQKQTRKPLYTPDSLNNIFYDLGVPGIKNFQKAALAARLYDTNDVVAFGNISEKDREIMKSLMEQANLNGTTWESQMDILLEQAATAKAQGRGGGGGGGGGGNAVSTQIVYSQTSLAQGRTILTAVLKEALGRMPTDQELVDFINMLNEAESKSPVRTVTRTTSGGGRTRSVSRTTPSIVDPQQLAEEFAAGIDGGEPMRAKRETDYLMGYLNSLGGMA